MMFVRSLSTIRRPEIVRRMSSVRSMGVAAARTREFGIIGMARATMQGCQEHWSRLFLHYLEISLQLPSPTSSDPNTRSRSWKEHARSKGGGGVFAEAPPQPRSLSGLFASDEGEWLGSAVPVARSVQRNPNWTAASAVREYEWVRRKFQGASGSCEQLTESQVRQLFACGLAVWLKYWEQWGEEKPDWAYELDDWYGMEDEGEGGDEDQEQHPPEISRRPSSFFSSSFAHSLRRRGTMGRTGTLSGPTAAAGGASGVAAGGTGPMPSPVEARWGIQGSLQHRLAKEALAGAGAEAGAGGGGGGYLQGVICRQDEVVLLVGLAASIAPWQPSTACMCLLHLLDRLAFLECAARAAEAAAAAAAAAGLGNFSIAAASPAGGGVGGVGGVIGGGGSGVLFGGNGGRSMSPRSGASRASLYSLAAAAGPASASPRTTTPLISPSGTPRGVGTLAAAAAAATAAVPLPQQAPSLASPRSASQVGSVGRRGDSQPTSPTFAQAQGEGAAAATAAAGSLARVGSDAGMDAAADNGKHHHHHHQHEQGATHKRRFTLALGSALLNSAFSSFHTSGSAAPPPPPAAAATAGSVSFNTPGPAAAAAAATASTGQSTTTFPPSVSGSGTSSTSGSVPPSPGSFPRDNPLDSPLSVTGLPPLFDLLPSAHLASCRAFVMSCLRSVLTACYDRAAASGMLGGGGWEGGGGGGAGGSSSRHELVMQALLKQQQEQQQQEEEMQRKQRLGQGQVQGGVQEVGQGQHPQAQAQALQLQSQSPAPSPAPALSPAPAAWAPLPLSALAEIALAEGIGQARHSNLAERCEEIDRLYYSFGFGPGLVATNLAVEARQLRHLHPEDLLATARHCVRMGLHEAAFQFGMGAVATGRLGVDGFSQVISMVFHGRGVESVSARFARLATAIKAAPGSAMAAAPTAIAAAVTAAVASTLGPAAMSHAGLQLPALPQPTPPPVYIGQFADAMLRSTQLKQRFPWAYEVTLNFLRMNLRGSPGAGPGSAAAGASALAAGAAAGTGSASSTAAAGRALAPPVSDHTAPAAPSVSSSSLSSASSATTSGVAALEALERELAAHVVLNRWLGIGLPGSGVRTVGQAEERAVEVVEQIAAPEHQVGWGVWLRVGRMLESEQQQLAMLLETMHVKSVMHTYELIDVNGEAGDFLALEAFDWGLQGLLACLEPSDGAAELVDLIYPLDEERVLLCLAIAARMAATHTVGSGRRWPTRDLPKFVAELLSLAESWRMESQQMSRAVNVVTLLWGWALPKREQLMDQCGSADEAREVLERTASSIWRSLAQGAQK